MRSGAGRAMPSRRRTPRWLGSSQTMCWLTRARAAGHGCVDRLRGTRAATPPRSCQRIGGVAETRASPTSLRCASAASHTSRSVRNAYMSISVREVEARHRDRTGRRQALQPVAHGRAISAVLGIVERFAQVRPATYGSGSRRSPGAAGASAASAPVAPFPAVARFARPPAATGISRLSLRPVFAAAGSTSNRHAPSGAATRCPSHDRKVGMDVAQRNVARHVVGPGASTRSISLTPPSKVTW